MAVQRILGEHRDALVAGADLSNALFLAAVVNSSKQIVLAGADAKPTGFIIETAPQGRPASIATGGIINAKAGGVIAAGDELSVDANSKVIKATTAGEGFGYARSAAAAVDDVVEVYFK